MLQTLVFVRKMRAILFFILLHVFALFLLLLVVLRVRERFCDDGVPLTLGLGNFPFFFRHGHHSKVKLAQFLIIGNDGQARHALDDFHHDRQVWIAQIHLIRRLIDHSRDRFNDLRPSH